MPVSQGVIEEAVARYSRERDRYLKLALRVADLCRIAVVEGNAIRAQVTFRTKSVQSFEDKLVRFSRRPDKNFKTADDVFAQISDFAGVRIATYRPEDEERVIALVSNLFVGPDDGAPEVDCKDKLNPAHGQFYRATHIQAFLPEPELIGDFGNLRGASCEIQVCSMMAHVWNEIEHDIGYKPDANGPSETERGLLETLGHLARAGDAAITRLLAATEARLATRTGAFDDVHDFVAQLRQFFPDADLSVNAGQAFEEIRALGLNSAEKMREELGGEVLDGAVAQERIERFNAYLLEQDLVELTLNPASADLVTIGILHARAAEIAAPGKASSYRMHELATAYEAYRAAGGAQVKAA
jgi:ppGpp synthetase/RelA/SpoT-type nucleotidyltranferase